MPQTKLFGSLPGPGGHMHSRSTLSLDWHGSLFRPCRRFLASQVVMPNQAQSTKKIWPTLGPTP